MHEVCGLKAWRFLLQSLHRAQGPKVCAKEQSWDAYETVMTLFWDPSITAIRGYAQSAVETQPCPLMCWRGAGHGAGRWLRGDDGVQRAARGARHQARPPRAAGPAHILMPETGSAKDDPAVIAVSPQ